MHLDNLRTTPPPPRGGFALSLLDYAKSSRRQRSNRSTNGTLTFRRSSTTPYGSSQSSQVDPTIQTSSAATQESQPQTNASYGPTDSRYSKTSLLDLFKAQQNSEVANKDVSSLFTNSWDPGHSNGANGRGWGKSHDGRDTQGPDVCWDSNGSVQPISLEEMTELEKSVRLPNN